jgi:hypothetical protein
MFALDLFPCLQVCSMKRFKEEDLKPHLSRFAIQVCSLVQGMVQITQDKRAIHIAVRVKDVTEDHKGIKQLDEMETMVFEQLDERSKGTEINVSYLSPNDLKKSHNLEDEVKFYTKEAFDEAREKDRDLGINRESVLDVNPNIKFIGK